MRKIIHVDMDAFFASVEQRENPEYRGKPIVVGGDPYGRGVVATCSYEARQFGIHSAMPAKRAHQLCPQAIFVRPRMKLYKEISLELMDIFYLYTNLVEPLSVDEAYLDVTDNKKNMKSATLIAKEMKSVINRRLRLTASAGVSYNKFIAKLASGYQKPDGLTVVTPAQAVAFIDRMPIRKFAGIGQVTEKQLKDLGIHKGIELREWSLQQLVELLGKRGEILYHQIRGEDTRQVNPKRVRKSIGKEMTLSEDIGVRSEMIPILEELAQQVATYLQDKQLVARVLVLKMKFHDFKQITRRLTLPTPIHTSSQIMKYILFMLERMNLEGKQVRLLGMSVADLTDDEPHIKQLSLFEEEDEMMYTQIEDRDV
ncbi:DNA polymerase IV [Hazenella sp. IB182353]|uniref:DNA polymerase IV n=1 Tax=Polycladospora coralii TaxID=2771432 RepID=UPI001BD096BB|nr:DNA polymerase IV [Polycladospora coralii]MBS7531602.1 DNA polymerase IV [Polycladospora coralii]